MNRAVPIILLSGLLGGQLLRSTPGAEQPPAVNPFGRQPQVREDATAGYIELSDGAVHAGKLYLTRDARLEVLDEQSKRRSEIPLSAVRRIECKVERQWMERQWRFKESANNEKVYTGRAYPARQYVHTITLSSGRTVRGALSAIVFVQDHFTDEVKRFLLHKRQKGPLDSDLESLVFVRTIELGDEALETGKRKAAEGKSRRSGKKGS
jgi:hypothetical protein